MKTKNWEDEFDKYKLKENGKWKIERVFAKQFIIEIRKRDMEELVKIFKDNYSDYYSVDINRTIRKYYIS